MTNLPSNTFTFVNLVLDIFGLYMDRNKMVESLQGAFRVSNGTGCYSSHGLEEGL